MSKAEKLSSAEELVDDTTEVLRGLEYCLSLFRDELQCPETFNVHDTRRLVWLVSDELKSCTAKLDRAYDLIDQAKGVYK